jgi:uncharacterized tellurite resistance protein B-like protein
MFKALTDLIDQAFGGGDDAAAGDRGHTIELATALLLVEVARADYQEDAAEYRELVRLLEQNFALSSDEIEQLVEEAKSEADRAASLQEFTRKLHESLTVEEKHNVVEMLWRVALADRHLDKHEDYLVRKISDLLYVSHKDLIRIRNRVSKRYQ